MNVIEECDFGPISGLTELKVLTCREYHREAALAGHEPARKWLEQEYPGWGNLPWKKVPKGLRTERIKKLEQEEQLAAASQTTLSLEEDREAHAQAVVGDRPLFALPNRITQEALSKVDGLTRQKYERLLAQRGLPTREAPWLVIDWSLPDETNVKSYRAFLKQHRPIEPIEQEKGKSSTKRQLLVIVNALVVYRLLHRAGLSIPKAVERMEKHGLVAPYSLDKEQRWREAEALATMLLRELRHGNFVLAIQRVVMSRQARKLLVLTND